MIVKIIATTSAVVLKFVPKPAFLLESGVGSQNLALLVLQQHQARLLLRAHHHALRVPRVPRARQVHHPALQALQALQAQRAQVQPALQQARQALLAQAQRAQAQLALQQARQALLALQAQLVLQAALLLRLPAHLLLRLLVDGIQPIIRNNAKIIVIHHLLIGDVK
jgi:hypothetical protein